MTDKNSLRILYPDTLVVMANGDVLTVQSRHKERFARHPTIAFVNPSEMPEAYIRHQFEESEFKPKFIGEVCQFLNDEVLALVHYQHKHEQSHDDIHTYIDNNVDRYKDTILQGLDEHALEPAISYIKTKDDVQKEACLDAIFEATMQHVNIPLIVSGLDAVSYTHLTLPTNREV